MSVAVWCLTLPRGWYKLHGHLLLFPWPPQALAVSVSNEATLALKPAFCCPAGALLNSGGTFPVSTWNLPCLFLDTSGRVHHEFSGTSPLICFRGCCLGVTERSVSSWSRLWSCAGVGAGLSILVPSVLLLPSSPRFHFLSHGTIKQTPQPKICVSNLVHWCGFYGLSEILGSS